MHLLWGDDFTSPTLNTSVWAPYPGPAHLNAEQETYPPLSPTNCVLTGSSLQLIPLLDSKNKWTSCRLETIPAFTPPAGGKLRVQSRFKLGKSSKNQQGLWPAFWSLGESIRHGVSWPTCGEIDTFEEIDGRAIGYGSVHCGTHCHGLSAGLKFGYGGYHTWAHEIDLTESDWRNQTISFSMGTGGGSVYQVVHGSQVGNETLWANLAQKGMFVIFDVAVGGLWPGKSNNMTVQGIDAGMEVQYVAVYSSG